MATLCTIHHLGVDRSTGAAATATQCARRSLVGAAAAGLLVRDELIFAAEDAGSQLVELIVDQFGAAIELIELQGGHCRRCFVVRVLRLLLRLLLLQLGIPGRQGSTEAVARRRQLAFEQGQEVLCSSMPGKVMRRAPHSMSRQLWRALCRWRPSHLRA